ncbi:siderophore-interacting protein [Kitasatospora sp. NPDC001574]
MGHGWEGVVLKLMRGKDFPLTVTGAEDVTEHCRRVHFRDGGMLAVTGIHPTMWVRVWFPGADRPHQRAYTLVDPDPLAGTFAMEFALHEGPASRWAQGAKPGDTVQATVQGSAFVAPDPAPERMFLIGDSASASTLSPGGRPLTRSDSRAVCRITTAAAWSTTERPFFALTPEARSPWVAVTVDIRSSTSRTGTGQSRLASRAA